MSPQVGYTIVLDSARPDPNPLPHDAPDRIVNYVPYQLSALIAATELGSGTVNANTEQDYQQSAASFVNANAAQFTVGMNAVASSTEQGGSWIGSGFSFQLYEQGQPLEEDLYAVQPNYKCKYLIEVHPLQ